MYICKYANIFVLTLYAAKFCSACAFGTENVFSVHDQEGIVPKLIIQESLISLTRLI